jgi:heptosyltransferase-2
MYNDILIIGPAWVGDMVMAQCLFKLLQQKQPSVKIDVLAPAWSLPLLCRMPEVRSAIVMPVGHGRLDLQERYNLAKKLREKRYAQAIVLPNSFKSALIPWFARIPIRTGWRGEMRYLVLNDIRILDKKRYPLMVQRFMALGLMPHEEIPDDYPIPQLKIASDDQVKAQQKYGMNGPEAPVLALCPGAEFGAAKRWPAEYYAEVANSKLNEGWQVWIFGSPKDTEVATHIMQLTQQRCVNLTGQTTLQEAIDLLALSTAVLSNDSGLLHIAAALGKPLVAVYGPTSATFTPPLNPEAKTLSLALDCQPCFQRECPLQHHRCMRELTPQKVLLAFSSLYKGGSLLVPKAQI